MTEGESLQRSASKKGFFVAVLLFHVGEIVFELVQEQIILSEAPGLGAYFLEDNDGSRRSVVLVDARGSKPPDAATRKEISVKYDPKAQKAKSIVFAASDDLLIRGALTALSWFYEGNVILKAYPSMETSLDALGPYSVEITEEARTLARAVDQLVAQKKSTFLIREHPTFQTHARRVRQLTGAQVRDG